MRSARALCESNAHTPRKFGPMNLWCQACAKAMERGTAIVSWSALCAVIEPHYPKAGNGGPPIWMERMLRIHFIQHLSIWPIWRARKPNCKNSWRHLRPQESRHSS